MDQTFYDIQAKIAKRLIHSDRHRRRKSIVPEIVTCNSKNHDLSRLKIRNEVLFKDLKEHLTSLQQEQRRRHGEMMRSEKAFTRSYNPTGFSHSGKKTCNKEVYPKMRSSSILAKHANLVKNDVVTSEERLRRWRENIYTRSAKPAGTQAPSTWGKLDKDTLQVPNLVGIREESLSSLSNRKKTLRRNESRVSEKRGGMLSRLPGDVTPGFVTSRHVTPRLVTPCVVTHQSGRTGGVSPNKMESVED